MNPENELRDSAIESSDDDDSVSSADECPICFETRKKGSIALLPCTHSFDLACIRRWMIAKLPETIRCPLCRSDVTTVLLNWGQQNEKEVSVGQLLVNEDIILARKYLYSEFSIQDRALFMEARRLQDLSIQRLIERGLVSVTYGPIKYMSIVAPFEDGIAVISRAVSLNIKQLGNGTSSTLRRWLKIDYHKPKFTSTYRDLQSRARSSSRLAMHKARQEIQYLQEEYSEAYKWPNTRSMRWVYRLPHQHLARTDRGIHQITLSRKVQATETPRALQLSSGKTSINIKWTTGLIEWGLARPDGSAILSEEDDAQTHRVRKRVRLATEQIRSALEWLRGSNANDQVDRLDRLTTNILEPGSRRAEQCRDCPAKHIPGSCLEQWSLIHP